MAVTIRFLRLASKEYADAYRWYLRKKAQVARRFVGAIDLAVQQIEAAPSRWPIYRGAYRWIRPRRFPYTLFNRILDADNVVIAAVAHDSRRPGYWLKRMRP